MTPLCFFFPAFKYVAFLKTSLTGLVVVGIRGWVNLLGSQGSRRNASKKGGPIGSEDVDKEGGGPSKERNVG